MKENFLGGSGESRGGEIYEVNMLGKSLGINC